METGKAKLTVLFDPPFWVGLFEREHGAATRPAGWYSAESPGTSKSTLTS